MTRLRIVLWVLPASLLLAGRPAAAQDQVSPHRLTLSLIPGHLALYLGDNPHFTNNRIDEFTGGATGVQAGYEYALVPYLSLGGELALAVPFATSQSADHANFNRDRFFGDLRLVVVLRLSLPLAGGMLELSEATKAGAALMVLGDVFTGVGFSAFESFRGLVWLSPTFGVLLELGAGLEWTGGGEHKLWGFSLLEACLGVVWRL